MAASAQEGAAGGLTEGGLRGGSGAGIEAFQGEE